MRTRSIVTVGLLLVLGWSGNAHAHIKLLSPASWLNEDDSGGPQKGGPCGPGGYDDVMPVPESGMVTTFEAGETITVEWEETVAHSGHFRIALAANRDDLVDPDIDVDQFCNYDAADVPTEPHGNVLADGLFPRTGFPAADSFSKEITLPNEPCENCTLQVIQFMTNHPPSCIYYHCANIRIVAAGTSGTGGAGAAGAGASGTGGGAGASAGAGAGASGAGGMGATGAGGVGSGAGAGAAGTMAPTAGTGAAGMMPPPGTAGMPALAGAGGAAGAMPPVSGGGDGDSGGCNATGGAATHGAWLLAALVPWLRRRRGRQRPSPLDAG